MKKHLPLSAILVACLTLAGNILLAQAPGSFNYQGVARSSTGIPLATQSISIQASILQDNASGTAVYTETQNTITTAQGYFTLQIGGGTATLGSFGAINWGNGHSKWLQISIDPAGGTNFTLTGSSQLVSVPFALYSARSASAPLALKAKAPLSISHDSVMINPGTQVGDLISWDGDNWVAVQPPAPKGDTSISINNMQPYLGLSYCIALEGIFPSRNGGSDPFLGEIDIYPYNFEPRGWAYCDGQLLSIAQNTALFSLLGTTYGGNGTVNFALPDLRGRVPIGAQQQGPGLSNYYLGQMGGTESSTITIHR